MGFHHARTPIVPCFLMVDFQGEEQVIIEHDPARNKDDEDNEVDEETHAKGYGK